MANATVHIAAVLWLGAPIVQAHRCVCESMVAVNGHHGLSYRHGSGRHSCHNQVDEVLCHSLNFAVAYATREPHSLSGRNDKRPDGATQIP